MRRLIEVAALGLLLGAAAAWAGEQAGQSEQQAAGQGQQQAAAQEEPQVSPEVRRILDRMDEANRGLTTVRARVTYTRAIPLLEEQRQSKGRLTFKKPGMILLALGKPENEDVITDGHTWWVVDHNDEQVEVYEGGDQTQGEAVFLQFGYGKGSAALLDEYTVELASQRQAEEDDEPVTIYRLKFTPRPRKDRPARYGAIEVELSSRRWLPNTLVLHESGGEIVHTYELSKIVLNEDVDDDTFAYEPPRGYTVLHPLEERHPAQGAKGGGG